MSCWGWATWNDRWNMFIDDIDYLYHNLKDKDMNYAALPETDMFDQIKRNYQGTLKTWAIKWYATIFINKGLCLYPKQTLVDNIGFDGTGDNSGLQLNTYNNTLLNTKIQVKPISIFKESLTGKKYLIEAYKRIDKIQSKDFKLTDKLRNRYPSIVNLIFRIYKFVTKKHK